MKLQQMVNKVTHDIETLDLMYTSNPIALSACQTSVIKPESDLHQVTTNSTLGVTGGQRRNSTPTPEVATPEVATFNYQSANKEKLLEVLQTTLKPLARTLRLVL